MEGRIKNTAKERGGEGCSWLVVVVALEVADAKQAAAA